MSYETNINGRLGLGYGSKYQLLRMLGWHRNEFNALVADKLGLADNNIDWLDFGYKGKYDDEELLNFDFIPLLKEEWRQYWACGRAGVNWDAIGVASDKTYILVEAKAHIGEFKNSCSASGESKSNNVRRIQELLDKYHIDSKADNWLAKDYQLANRLVSLDYLLTRGYKAKLVYLLFVNGYEQNTEDKKSASKEQYDAALNNEFNRLGIKDTELERMINVIYINCKH